MRLLNNLNLRSFVSLTIFLSFMVILVTSILMFVQKHETSIALVHTIVGFGLLLIAIWHLKNNFTPLKKHFKWRAGAQGHRVFNIALPFAVTLSLVLVLLSLNQFSPLLAVYEWGNTLRATAKSKPVKKMTYERVDKTNVAHKGPQLTIDLRKGPYFLWPQYAIWLETLKGEFIRPIYVTSSLAKNNFVNKVTKKDKNIVFDSHIVLSGKVNPEEVFEFQEDSATKEQRIRPDSLPVFLHQLGKKSADGFFVPTEGDLLVDSFTGATMLDNFLLDTRLKDTLPSGVKVKFEINNSFDFNQYYSSDRFPDDPVYSGNGYSAQPSIVYEAIIDFSSQQKYFPMTLIGHGHHSGKNGKLYKNMDNLSTALELVDRIIVEVK
jgi:hypothetical protein